MVKSKDSYVLESGYKNNPLPIRYRTIYEALVDIFPKNALAILHSISRVIIIEKDSPQFSTMGVTAEGTLFISRSFWDTFMVSKNNLRTVLMHELMHCISGDIYTFKTEDDSDDFDLLNKADLIAMDARINAYICNSRPDFYPESFLISFYDEEQVKLEPLSKLLRPGSVFDTNDPDEALLKPYYNKFYKSEEFCSHAELAEVIYNILKKRPKNKKLTIKLLGGHSKSGQELTDEDLEGVEEIEIDSSELTEEDMKPPEDYDDGIDTSAGTQLPDRIKEAIDQHLANEASKVDSNNKSSKGAGKGVLSAVHMVALKDSVTEKFDVAKFKKMFVDNVFHNVRSQARKKVGSFATSPLIPNHLATSNLIMAAQNYPIMLWKVKKYEYVFDNNLLPIYLDVSGSTRPYLPEIIKLITNVSKELHFVWGFSNRIEKHTTDELKQGITKGTGGTDFDCVIDHAIENKFKHIVVITDGDAYTRREGSRYSSNPSSNKLSEIDSVVTVLFGYSNKANYFSRVYGNTHTIEEVTV